MTYAFCSCCDQFVRSDWKLCIVRPGVPSAFANAPPTAAELFASGCIASMYDV